MMSVAVYDCQRQVEEEKDDEAEIVINRLVAQRHQFTLYEKMAAV